MKLRHLAACGAIFLLLPAASIPARARDCAAPPPAVRDIALPRFYGDATGSIVDPQRAAAHKAAVAPLDDFVRHVTQLSDKAVLRTKPGARAEAAQCALAWLSAWAAGGALLGRMQTKQAEYQRKWDLAGLALAYLEVRAYARPEQRRSISGWLKETADRARAFFDDPGHKRNNHWYWMGLALGAVGLATDSPAHWHAARAVYDDALADIAADGSLPHEIARKARALHYHSFALMPLVVLAELAQSRGEDWYSRRNGALHRLVSFTVEGFAEPARVARLAGTPQEQTRPGAGWSYLYARRFPERLARPLAGASDGHRWLGGKVDALAATLAPRR